MMPLAMLCAACSADPREISPDDPPPLVVPSPVAPAEFLDPDLFEAPQGYAGPTPVTMRELLLAWQADRSGLAVASGQLETLAELLEIPPR